MIPGYMLHPKAILRITFEVSRMLVSQLRF